MATHFRLFDAGEQFSTSTGVLAGGLMTTYDAGTTTERTTYQDNAGAVAHTNPIVLDADGRLPDEVWVTTGDTKIVVTTSASGAVFTADNITAVNDVTVSAASEWVAGPTPTRTGDTTFTLAGDQTATFHVGRRLQLTDSSVLYGRISASTFSSVTTVTVVVDGGTALTASLTAVSYGLLSKTNSSLPSVGVDLLDSGTLTTENSLDITGFTTEYIKYELILSNIIPDTDNDFTIEGRVSISGTFQSGATDYAWGGFFDNEGQTGPASRGSAGADAFTDLFAQALLGTATGENLNGRIEIFDPMNTSTNTAIHYMFTGKRQAADVYTSWGAGIFQDSGGAPLATDGIQVIASTSNLISCDWVLYGYRKS